jgi:glutaminase
MTCSELAHSFSFFSMREKNEEENKFEESSKEVECFDADLRFYDESGEFTYKVGLPGKSGIGGGIVALFPKIFVVATWSPKLNKKGNSDWECMH